MWCSPNSLGKKEENFCTEVFKIPFRKEEIQKDRAVSVQNKKQPPLRALGSPVQMFAECDVFEENKEDWSKGCFCLPFKSWKWFFHFLLHKKRTVFVCNFSLSISHLKDYNQKVGLWLTASVIITSLKWVWKYNKMILLVLWVYFLFTDVPRLFHWYVSQITEKAQVHSRVSHFHFNTSRQSFVDRRIAGHNAIHHVWPWFGQSCIIQRAFSSAGWRRRCM